MGITQRKLQEKQELSKKILDAAMELFTQQGFEQTSIRNIAKKIEYSPTTIYIYFKDKDAIFHALHQQGFEVLNLKMGILMYVQNPMERLKAMGKVYIDFALENPSLYELMFISNAPLMEIDSDEDKDWLEGSNAFSFLKSTLKECRENGYFPQQDLEATSFVVWSAMHGMVSLHIKNRSKKIFPENRDTIVQSGYNCLIQIIESLKK